MRFRRKTPVMVILVAIVSLSAALTTSGSKPEINGPASNKEQSNGEQRQYLNLKVLPKDISSKDLQRIMIDDFEDGLGVSCNFCHVKAKDSVHFDFVSDVKPEKQIARSMMRMTLLINKKFFKIKHPEIGSPMLAATCNTCHQGVAFPAGF